MIRCFIALFLAVTLFAPGASHAWASEGSAPVSASGVGQVPADPAATQDENLPAQYSGESLEDQAIEMAGDASALVGFHRFALQMTLRFPVPQGGAGKNLPAPYIEGLKRPPRCLS